MFQYHIENISEIVNVNSVIQDKYDTGKTPTRIMEYFLKISTNTFLY